MQGARKLTPPHLMASTNSLSGASKIPFQLLRPKCSVMDLCAAVEFLPEVLQESTVLMVASRMSDLKEVMRKKNRNKDVRRK